MNVTFTQLLDIAQVSVDHAKERYRNMRGASFEAKFLAYDAFHVNIKKIRYDYNTSFF